MKIHISPGNTKLGSIPSFSLPPAITCPGSTALCRKICYAASSERRYYRTRNCWANNLTAVKAEKWTENMVHHIYCQCSRYWRIHVAGDFFSQDYLDQWIELAKIFSEIQFLAFTKSFKLDFSKAPTNLNILWSVFPDTIMEDIPPGARAITTIPGHDYPDSILKDAVKCGGLCTACQICFHSNENKLNVYFEAHGGGYNSAKARKEKRNGNSQKY